MKYLYHLTGYTPSGKRINRRYKTKKACDRMIKKMSVINCAFLKIISKEAILAALAKE